MTRKQKRLMMLCAGLAVLAVAAGLVLYAMRDNIVFFYTPSDITEKAIPPGTRIRLGGLVEQGSGDPGDEALLAYMDTLL